jgi:quercetin dioxygenase-like cupin family protein
MVQTFQDLHEQVFEELSGFSGSSWTVLAQPVPEGSIHRLKMKKGTRIPAHTHPADEYVYVLSGKITTGGRQCDEGCFWFTPAGTRQGPHLAETDVEIITVRLGPMGEFDAQ